MYERWAVYRWRYRKSNVRFFGRCPTGLDSLDNIDYAINYSSQDHDRLRLRYKFGNVRRWERRTAVNEKRSILDNVRWLDPSPLVELSQISSPVRHNINVSLKEERLDSGVDRGNIFCHRSPPLLSSGTGLIKVIYKTGNMILPVTVSQLK